MLLCMNTLLSQYYVNIQARQQMIKFDLNEIIFK
jgi:hypothetical protein